MAVPADYYDQGIRRNLAQALWHQGRIRQIGTFLPKEPKEVLDIGSHAGRLTQELVRLLPEAKVWAVDPDPAAVAYGREKRPEINFQEAEGEALPFKAEAFDLITCLEVLEHVKDPNKVLSEAKRCLKREGELVVLVPSENWLFKLIWFFWTKGKGRVWQGAHLHQFKNGDLGRLFKQNGFKIKKRGKSHLGMLRILRAVKDY